MDGHSEVERLARDVRHRGPIFSVVREHIRLPSGLEQDLEIVEHDGAVAVAALTAEGSMVLVRQYRHAVGRSLLEVPAGRLEPGEDPAAAAHRELEEETGLKAGSLTLLREFFPAPGFCSEHMTLFLARDLSPAGAGRLSPDADEELEVLELPPAEVLCRSLDAKTLVAAALLMSATAVQERVT